MNRQILAAYEAVAAVASDAASSGPGDAPGIRMNNSSRVLGTGVLALVALGAFASVAGCSTADAASSKRSAWSCANDEIPMGSVVHCTSSALTADGPTGGNSGGTTDATASATTDGTAYVCPPANDNPDCPPADSSGTTNGGTTGGGTADGTTTTDSPPNPSDDGVIGECAFVPDLVYCGGTTDGTSDTGNVDCGKPVCAPPGQTKKDGGGGGASSSSGGGGSGKEFTCTKDEHGNKSCVSSPQCAPGTHPSPCGACVSDSDGTADCVPPGEGGCWVTGGGFIDAASLAPPGPADGHDNFGGNAKPMKRGDVSGHWNHVDHGTGNHALGRPEYIMCRTVEGAGPGQPGGKKVLVANQVYFGGHAQWRTAADATWRDGFWFDVVAEDHGEPGNTSAKKGSGATNADSYHFTLRQLSDPTKLVSGPVVYETRGDLVGGNIQLHPSNGGHPSASSPLPSWVSLEP